MGYSPGSPVDDKVILRRLRIILCALCSGVVLLTAYGVTAHFVGFSVKFWHLVWVFGGVVVATDLLARVVNRHQTRADDAEWKRETAIRLARLEDQVKAIKNGVPLEVLNARMLGRIDRLARQVNMLTNAVHGHDMDEILIQPQPHVDPNPTIVQPPSQDSDSTWYDRIADEEQE
jgi:hypothetical protein